MLLLGSIRSIMRICIRTDNVFFRKPTRPSLPLKKAFSKTYPSFLTLKEGSTFLTKPLFPQEREDVAGSAIAPPEFWSASEACAHEGLAGSAYATELRLFDSWRIVEFADNLQIFGFFLGGFNKKA